MKKNVFFTSLIVVASLVMILSFAFAAQCVVNAVINDEMMKVIGLAVAEITLLMAGTAFILCLSDDLRQNKRDKTAVTETAEKCSEKTLFSNKTCD